MIPNYNIEDFDKWIPSLKAGDEILISGKILTARDAVHKKWMDLLNSGGKLPISFEHTGIYYTGTTPPPDGLPSGSCGPTTSARMDVFYEMLASHGLRLTIGKGVRSEAVKRSIATTKGIYLCAIGGAGALYGKCIKNSKLLCYEELGCEALREIELEDFPVFVGIDSNGNSVF